MLSDLRYAARTLAKAPGFAAATVLTLALGIGANTAIFTVVDAELLRPLPFDHPERLVRIFEKNDKVKIDQFSASILNYLAWKERAQSFESMAAFGGAAYTLTNSGEPEILAGAPISPSLMPMLGIQPARGRAFREGDDAPGAPTVALISQGLWQRRFASDPTLIGKTIQLNGVPYTVIGIAPAALQTLLGATDIFTPMTIDRAKEIRLNHQIVAVARLKAGVTIAHAQKEMTEVSRQVGIAWPEVKDWTTTLLGFDRWFVGDQLRTALLVLLGAVGLVLLIACANIANLLLSRAVARQSEIAVRTALGASRGRLIRQLLTESLSISLAGGIAGVFLATWAVRAIQAALPQGLLPISDLHVDSGVMLFALAITLGTGILFGLAPAWHTAKTDLNTVLKQGGRAAAGGAKGSIRNALAAAELALATILLAGAGLLIQSLAHLQQAPLGFHPERLLTFQIGLPQTKYPTVVQAWGFYQSFLASMRSLPGVRGAAISSGVPMGSGNYTHSPFTPTGSSLLPPGAALPADWRTVSPGFFATMGIPLLRGRDFGPQDTPTTPVGVIVSQNMARKIWGDQDPIGRVVSSSTNRNFTVAGVVGDVRGTALNTPPEPTIYFAASVRQWPLMDVAVRTSGDPVSAVSAIRARLHELDAQLPMASVRTMDDWISNNAAQPRLNTTLLSVFAGIALLIAAIGIYGVLSYSVTQRTREIGLRMALGAQQSSVLGLVVREGMVVAALGIGAGIAGSLALSRVMSTLLFDVTPHDPATLTMVAAGLTAVALAACCIPARRAARVDPIVALRDE
jgi:putative ABC transport system permease protein